MIQRTFSNEYKNKYFYYDMKNDFISALRTRPYIANFKFG